MAGFYSARSWIIPPLPWPTFAPPLSDIDIVIRSGGGNRLSNFMIWEANYAELVTVDELWPDFEASSIPAILERLQSVTKYGS